MGKKLQKYTMKSHNDGELKKENKKICFVSLNSSSLLSNNHSGYIGGAEVQQVLIANELKDQGFEISFVTYGNNLSSEFNGIQIFQIYNRSSLECISLFKKVWLIAYCLKKVDADIFTHRSGSPGITSLLARLKFKKSIIHISSDAKIMTKFNFSNISQLLLSIGDFIDIKLADYIIVQNSFQQQKIKKLYGRNSEIVSNAIPVRHAKNNKKEEKKQFVWIGNIREIKQPIVFLQLASNFPDYKFLMIGGKGKNDEFNKRTITEIKKIPNVDYKGFVHHDKIDDYLKKSMALINTSKFEGFPNVFLEAWNQGLPVISLNVNPNNIIERYQLGFHSKSLNNMIQDLKKLIHNSELQRVISLNAKKYILLNHDVKKITQDYIKIIEKLE